MSSVNSRRENPVNVTIKPGIYSYDRFTEFGPKDSGTAEAPETLNFQQKANAPGWMPKIFFEKIGLQLDETRKARPAPAKYRPAARNHFKGRPSCNRNVKYDFDKVNETIYWNSEALLQSLNTTK